MKVWILTMELNEYDQYGEYFVRIYANKPTHQQLTSEGVAQNRLRHTLDGGGRVGAEDRWYFLREVELS